MIKHLKLLADETRLRLLRLCDGEELNVHELTGILGMAQPRVSNHLRLLREAGLLDDRREGTWAYYRMPAAESLPATLAALWRQARAWMEAERFFPTDLSRRREALEARAAPAERYFDSIGAGWDDIGLRLVDESMRERLLLSLTPPGLVVADIGCGSGRFLGLLSPLVRKAIGVEPSAKMIETARRNAERHGWGNVEIRRGSLERLPLKRGELDAAYCSLTLHHSPRPAEALAELARALKRGGRLIVCDFAAHNVDWLREEMADFWLGFEPETLKEWMRKAGLTGARVSVLGRVTARPRRAGRRAAELTVLAATARKPSGARRV